jgi:hypothetical protein
MTDESIFAAVALPDPAARAAYLDRACAGNVELRNQLDALVAAHFAPDPVLDQTRPPPESEHTQSVGDRTHSRTSPLEAVGTVIAGRYKLLQQIGERGMGSVWMADQTEPDALAKVLRSELDWLVMKALEKDRNRRYDSANGLAADVQRYLAGEAVTAVPPSVGYRVRKWVRKNRGLVTTSGLVAASLLAGTGMATWQTYAARAALGGVLARRGNWVEAEPLLLDGYAGMKQREKAIPLPLRGADVRPGGSAHRPVHRHGQAERSGEVAGRAGEVPRNPAPAAAGEVGRPFGP